jgi:hypothetical protein
MEKEMLGIKQFLIVVLVCVSVTLLLVEARADKAADCDMMLENAIALFREKGPTYTLKVLNTRGPFTDGEICVFAVSMGGVMLAHPYEKELVGKNVTDVKDARGNAVYQLFGKIAEAQGVGWVEHVGPRQGQSGVFKKRTLIKRVLGGDLYFGAGYIDE